MEISIGVGISFVERHLTDIRQTTLRNQLAQQLHQTKFNELVHHEPDLNPLFPNVLVNCDRGQYEVVTLPKEKHSSLHIV